MILYNRKIICKFFLRIPIKFLEILQVPNGNLEDKYKILDVAFATLKFETKKTNFVLSILEEQLN